MSIISENITLNKGITLTVGQQYYLINEPRSLTTAETPTQMYYLGTEWINDDHSADLEGQTKKLIFGTSPNASTRRFNVCQGEIFVYSSQSDAATAAQSMVNWMTSNNITCAYPAQQCPWGLNSGCPYKDDIPRKWVNNVLCDKNNNPLFNGVITKS